VAERQLGELFTPAIEGCIGPADCGKLIVEEIEKWAKVVRAGNIKPE
jgi:hypothetical protein